MEWIAAQPWLPYLFAFLIGFAMLLYAVLDGYDLGVGILSRKVKEEERDQMINSIGPFWDANETWLVLGVGLLLVAFPKANGIVLNELYLPVTLMILALVFRGVSFDFRRKVVPEKKVGWDFRFYVSSLIVAMTQGYMVGRFIVGFEKGVTSHLFALFFGVLVVAGYCLMGSTWLIMKGEGELQKKAIGWSRWALWTMVVGAIASSLMAVFVDTRIYDDFFRFPQLSLLIAMPVISIVFTIMLHCLLSVLPLEGDKLSWMPFAISVMIYILGFVGLVYSFYPYIIPGNLLITEAASANASLAVMLIGVVIVLPVLVGYTMLSYWIFRGKSSELHYD
jgi:cytochrome d ubiquinol oxidase subunit II